MVSGTQAGDLGGVSRRDVEGAREEPEGSPKNNPSDTQNASLGDPTAGS